ncbi:hypothetical protein [Aliikangiella maris]|uniref:Uncharacterized protein n=2 Tax=Aliikangiella maris TaxID=3162458 RepID=A0ABV2BSD7_9GAMM
MKKIHNEKNTMMIRNIMIKSLKLGLLINFLNQPILADGAKHDASCQQAIKTFQKTLDNQFIQANKATGHTHFKSGIYLKYYIENEKKAFICSNFSITESGNYQLKHNKDFVILYLNGDQITLTR